MNLKNVKRIYISGTNSVGGGILGGLALPIVTAFGLPGTYVIFICLAVIILFKLTGIHPAAIVAFFMKKFQKLSSKRVLRKNIEKELVVLDSIKLETLKTKELKSILETLELNGKTLFVTAEDNENLYMASRNLGYAYVVLANEINCYDLVNADYLVCDEAAVKYIEEVLK